MVVRRGSAAVAVAVLLLLGAGGLLAGLSTAPTGSAGTSATEHASLTGASGPSAPGAVPVSTPAPAGDPGTVARTIFVNYNASLAGPFGSTVKDWNLGPGDYVPSTGLLWLSDLPATLGLPGPLPRSAPAVLFDPATDAFVGLVPALSNTSDLVYDPANGLLYAADPLNGTVGVFNPVTRTWAAPAIAVGGDPYRLALDSVTGTLFVASLVSASLAEVDTSTNTLGPNNTSLPGGPVGLAVNEANQTLFVVYDNSSSLSILNASSLAPIFTQVLLGTAGGIAFAPQFNSIGVTIPARGYLTVVNGSDYATSSLVHVGLGARAVSPTPDGVNFLVSDVLATSVVLVNTTTGSIQGGSMYGGVNPASFETVGSRVYSWASGSRNLSLVWSQGSPATGSSPNLGANVTAGAYLPDNTTVLADAADNTLDAIPAPNTTAAPPPLALPGTPLSLALDPGAGTLEVGLSDGLATVDLSNWTVAGYASTPSGSEQALLYDPTTNLLWALNSVQGLLAFHVPSLSVALTVGLGSGQASIETMALDSATDQLFVPVNATGTAAVGVVDASNGTVVNGSLVSAPGLTSLAYDPADGTVYGVGGNVTLLNATTLRPAGLPIGIAPHVASGTIVYDASREYVYATAFALAYGAGTLTALDGSSVTATYGGEVTIPVGESPLAALVVPASPASQPSELWVANAQSGTVSLVANSPPSILSFGATPASIDLGGTTTFTVSVAGGAGPLTIQYSNLPPGCPTADGLVLSCGPTGEGSFAVTVRLTDSLGGSATATTDLEVGPTLSVTASFDLATFPEVDLGYPIAISGMAQGGSAPYSYTWSFGDGTASTGPRVVHTYNQTGDFVVGLTVSDATGQHASQQWALTVRPPPSVQIVAPSSTTDVGRSLSFSTLVEGGSSVNASALWTFGDGTSVTGLTVDHSWTAPGLYNVTVEYADGLGAGSSQSLEVLVNPDPTGQFSVTGGTSAQPAVPGTTFFYNSTLENGSGPFTVVWQFGDGSSATGARVTHAYAAPGNYTVSVTDTDAAGSTVNATLVVAVFASATPSSSGGAPPLTFDLGVFAGLLIGVAVGAIAVYAASGRRRRDRTPPPPPSPYVPPTRADWQEDD